MSESNTFLPKPEVELRNKLGGFLPNQILNLTLTCYELYLNRFRMIALRQTGIYNQALEQINPDFQEQHSISELLELNSNLRNEIEINQASSALYLNDSLQTLLACADLLVKSNNNQKNTDNSQENFTDTDWSYMAALDSIRIRLIQKGFKDDSIDVFIDILRQSNLLSLAENTERDFESKTESEDHLNFVFKQSLPTIINGATDYLNTLKPGQTPQTLRFLTLYKSLYSSLIVTLSGKLDRQLITQRRYDELHSAFSAKIAVEFILALSEQLTPKYGQDQATNICVEISELIYENVLKLI